MQKISKQILLAIIAVTTTLSTSAAETKVGSFLDKLNQKGVKFALSNVLEHKGLKNENLINWSKKYSITYIDYNYNNSNYHNKNIDKKTVEVLITNY